MVITLSYMGPCVVRNLLVLSSSSLQMWTSEGLEGVVADVESSHMNITTLLEDKTNVSVLPPVMLVSIPPQSDNHQTEILVVFEEPWVNTLMVARCLRQDVVKGKPSPTTENRSDLKWLVHDLNMKSCPYPGRVVECIYVTFESLGILFRFDTISISTRTTGPILRFLLTLCSLVDPEIMDLRASLSRIIFWGKLKSERRFCTRIPQLSLMTHQRLMRGFIHPWTIGENIYIYLNVVLLTRTGLDLYSLSHQLQSRVVLS